jgi:hypothetical protein
MTSEELDRMIVAYKRGNKAARTFHKPLDTKIAAYYRQHPEARTAVEKVRTDPRGLAAVMRDTLNRAAATNVAPVVRTGGMDWDGIWRSS